MMKRYPSEPPLRCSKFSLASLMKRIAHAYMNDMLMLIPLLSKLLFYAFKLDKCFNFILNVCIEQDLIYFFLNKTKPLNES